MKWKQVKKLAELFGHEFVKDMRTIDAKGVGSFIERIKKHHDGKCEMPVVWDGVLRFRLGEYTEVISEDGKEWSLRLRDGVEADGGVYGLWTKLAEELPDKEGWYYRRVMEYYAMFSCETCLGYGLWKIGEPCPVGPMDARDGVPTIECPDCGANANRSE